jgi:hypothetical protein
MLEASQLQPKRLPSGTSANFNGAEAIAFEHQHGPFGVWEAGAI